MTVINSIDPTSNTTSVQCLKRETDYGFDGNNSYRKVRTQLPKEHSLSRRYGINNIDTMYYNSETFCELEGTTFKDRPFRVFVSTRNKEGMNKIMRDSQYWLEQTREMTIPDYVVKCARNLEQEKSFSSDVVKQAPDAVKPNLKLWRRTNSNRKGFDKVITTELDKNHFLNKECGIEIMEVHNLSDGNRFIKLWGKTFNGRNFQEYVSSFANSSLETRFRNILDRLKKTHSINISDAVVNVAKFLR